MAHPKAIAEFVSAHAYPTLMGPWNMNVHGHFSPFARKLFLFYDAESGQFEAAQV